MKPDINVIISQVASIITQIIGIGLLLLIAVAVVAKFGFSQRIVPVVQSYELMLLCAAWWLYRGGRIT